jgi:hypothetical protein
MSPAVESALDELYSVEPSRFVETRKRLVAEHRAAKQSDVVEALTSARRPTRSAWAINQVTRQNPTAIESLLRTSDVLRELQAQGDASAREPLRDASKAHRAALNEAIDAAVAALGTTPSDAIRNEITTTFQAASIDPNVAADVRLGRLTVARTASTGFPEVERPHDATRRADRRSLDGGTKAKVDPALEKTWRAASAAVVDAEAAVAEADARVVELQGALSAAKADAATKARELRAARDRERKAKRAFEVGGRTR